MYMTKSDLLKLANDCRVHMQNLGSTCYWYWKHVMFLRRMRATLNRQYRQRLTLAANAFPRKACYPYGEQAMGKPKATGRDVWAHVGKRG